ncbi:hypothetical protein [Streptomyces sp. NRRL F-5135]|uniref:hypothetical protein n=1 Tax=Streptomyces sp. NRRL F-5135 TaxID=1463858 RepID=UPI0004CA1558|nr:hypothetical protein [Streptomyces sp. NRRL F-5135]
MFLNVFVAVLIVVAVAAGLWALQILRSTRRALSGVRAAARLAERLHERDMRACRARLQAVLDEHAVMGAADRVLDAALARHTTDPKPKKEGGSP